MEDVLAAAARPDDPTRPVVCLDQTGGRLHSVARPARSNPGYVRGSGNGFLVTEPPRGGATAATPPAPLSTGG